MIVHENITKINIRKYEVINDNLKKDININVFQVYVIG